MDSEMRSKSFAGWVAVSGPVGGEMLVVSTAGPVRLLGIVILGVKRRYSLLDCHRQP